MISAQEALQRLQEGNIRFTLDVRGPDAFMNQSRREEL
jgi:hypothetical protein